MSRLNRHPELPRVNTAELVQRLREVVVVDAHGPSYFALGHIPDAVNIPPHEVVRLARTRIGSAHVPVVVYGARGSTNAVIVADQLRALGYRDVAVYEDGLEGWIKAGRPIALDDGSEQAP